MNTRALLSSVGAILFLILLLVFLRPASASEDWSLDIVPSLSWDNMTTINLRGPFSVVLTNQTNRDLTVCNDFFYGGENDLTFLCTLSDGRKITLRSLLPGFTTHPADVYVVHPGGHYVLTICLDETRTKGWGGWTIDPTRKTLDLSPLKNARDVTVVAVFSHSTDERGTLDTRTKDPVWNGEIHSKPIKLTFINSGW